MTAAKAQRLVQAAYPNAFEGGSVGLRIVYGGPINRVVVGTGGTLCEGCHGREHHG